MGGHLDVSIIYYMTTKMAENKKPEKANTH